MDRNRIGEIQIQNDLLYHIYADTEHGSVLRRSKIEYEDGLNVDLTNAYDTPADSFQLRKTRCFIYRAERSPTALPLDRGWLFARDLSVDCASSNTRSRLDFALSIFEKIQPFMGKIEKGIFDKV